MEGIQNRIKGKDFIAPQCKGKFGVHTDGVLFVSCVAMNKSSNLLSLHFSKSKDDCRNFTGWCGTSNVPGRYRGQGILVLFSLLYC